VYPKEKESSTMARTNVVLDDDLVAQCQAVTGIPTKRSLIDHALQELLRHERQKTVLELKGRIAWHGDLSAWRKGRHVS
jgi:Arc/MetJ family transcription regulator